MVRQHAAFVAVLTLLASLLVAPTAVSAAADNGQVGSYIVVLNDAQANAAAEARQAANANGGTVGFVYEHALKGYSMTMSAQAAAALARNPKVAYVEMDRTIQLAAQDTPSGLPRIFADEAALDIDQTDDKRVDVDVAVIDTGVDYDHPDLNVVGGVSCKSKRRFGNATCSAGGDDDHYHGTHVAGTIGALDNDLGVVGVAPGARIWAVKVLDSNGSGSESMVVAGIDWVAANASTIEVANMSLGGAGYSQAEYDAIQGAVNAGVAFAVAAGNDSQDASGYSPASFDNALTVSALADFDGAPGGNGAATCRADEDDTLANFSNFGADVDIAAPGVCITSTYPLEEGGYGTISGTSMASPHVAGALALLASNNNPSNSGDVYGLYNQVTGTGNYNWTDESGDGILEPLLDISSSAFVPTLVDTNAPPPPPGDLTAAASGYKVKGVQHADISWSGASGDVDIYRDGSLIATTSASPYTDNLGRKGGGTATYYVCVSGTTTCSDTVTVTW